MPWPSKMDLPALFVVAGPVKPISMNTGLLNTASSSSARVGKAAARRQRIVVDVIGMKAADGGDPRALRMPAARSA